MVVLVLVRISMLLGEAYRVPNVGPHRYSIVMQVLSQVVYLYYNR